ncbi:GTP-binding protein [Vibrio cholerae]|uniref:CobW family GTP-binding protein n=1 Tax=Vibrio cholerae TaxID=666 RepID=UPI0006E6F546|nr:GTP-binding protein [Vibrio cholerae]KQA48489.1 GTPase [Vibrio cholerae]KQA56765.1 GTPase [Vibrio cholerae]KQA70157.1 GTPase [Vibrio cholerae]PAS08091.1 GTP-binding protein [Vibrio cholerae]PAS15964.1 GTP-binding protein [Vibrio cholerae]
MINRVPTNIITGFLGVGKTTAILHLLATKPAHEKWAVLVNEFGEIGIDGAIMSEQGAMIKEVPGGCLCCTAGVPMSVGINALLRQKPDRLIIEPTGLGHPKQVVATLISEQYQPYVDLKATIALMDPRHLSMDKYRNNQNFNDQLASADIVLGNKVDQCSSSDIDAFNDWVTDQTPAKTFSQLIKQGQFPIELLDMPRLVGHASTHIDSPHHHHAADEPQFQLAPQQPFLRKENRGQGYFSCGWLFGAEYQFNFDLLFQLLNDLTAERVKGVLNTDRGCYAFNVANGVVSVTEMSLEGFESRLEVIDSQLMPWSELESILLKIAGIPQA